MTKSTSPLILSTLACLSFSLYLDAATWTTGGGGSWGNSIHWSPHQRDEEAAFLMTAAGPTTVTLHDDQMQPANFTLTNLSFDSSSQVYVLEGDEKHGLNFVRSSSSLPSISISGCNEVINSNITINSDTTLSMMGTAPSLTLGVHSSLTSAPAAVLKINPHSQNLGHLMVLSTQNGGFAANTSIEIGENSSREDAGSASITNNGGLFGIGSPSITVYKGHILNENLGVFGKICPQITLSGNLINQTGATFGSSVSHISLNGGTILNDIGAGTTLTASSLRVNTSSSPTSFYNHGHVMTEQDFIVQPGAHAVLTNITNSNSARVKTSTVGSSMTIGGSLIFHGNTFKNQNQGQINLEGKAVYGSFVEIQETLAIGPTSHLHNINTGDGDISGNAGNIGSFLSILSHSSPNCSFSEGTILNQNDAEIRAGAGSKILFHKDLLIHSGTINNHNTNQGIISGASYGSILEVLGNVSMTGGTMISSNSGAVGPSLDGAGSFIHLPHGDLHLSGGSITCSNNGPLTTSTGSKIYLGGGLDLSGSGALTLNNTEGLSNQGIGCGLQASHFSMTDALSKLNLVNEGALKGAHTGVSANFNGNFSISNGMINLSNTSNLVDAIGVSLTVQGSGNTLTISGGTVNNHNSGLFTGTGIGSQIHAPRINMSGGTLNNTGQVQTTQNFTISGGTLNNTNALSVNRNSVSGISGSQISVEGSLHIFGSASIHNHNHGTVNGIEKAFYGSDLVIQGAMTMSGGTLSSIHMQGNFPVTNDSNSAGAAIRVLKGDINLLGGAVHCQNDGIVILGTGSLFTTPHDLNISHSANLTFVNTSSSIDYGVSTGSGCQLSVNNLNVIGGSMTLSNTGNLIGENIGCLGKIAHDLTLRDGKITLSNTGKLTRFENGNIAGTALEIGGTLTMNGGSISIRDAEGLGSSLSAAGITINAGTFENDNSFVQSKGDLTISGGSFINSGVLVNETLFIHGGTLMNGSLLQVQNRLAMTQGLLSNKNSGTIRIMQGDLALSGGTLHCTNTGLVGAEGIGSHVWTAGNTRLNGSGHLKLTNNASLNSPSFGSLLETHHLTLQNNAVLTLENDALLIDAKAGVLASIQGDLQINGGRLSLNNRQGNFVNSVVLKVDGAFNLNGGILANESSFGSRIESRYPIHVHGGKFINHGHIKADEIYIHAGGTVTGSGIFDSHIVAHTTTNSGYLQPGNQERFTSTPPIVLDPLTLIPIAAEMTTRSYPGKMTLKGRYTQTKEGTLAIQILNNESMGHLTAKHASLQGTLHVDALPGFSLKPGTTELEFIATDPDGVEGIFDAFTCSPEIRKLDPFLVYGTNSVLLHFNIPAPTLSTPLPLPRARSYLGGTTNQIFFSMINRHNTGLEREMQRLRDRMYPREKISEKEKSETSSFSRRQRFATATSGQKTVRTSNSISPAFAAGPTQLAFFNWALQQKQQQLSEEISTPPPKKRPWNLYFAPTATIGDVNTKDNQLGANYWDIGGIVGVDYAFSQVGLGASVDYGRTQVQVNKDWGKYHFNYIHSSLYATYAPRILPELAFNGIVGGSYEWYDIRRNTIFPVDLTASANTKGSEFDAFFGTEYVFSGEQFSGLPNRLQIIPRASLQYVYLDINKFTEHKAEIATLELHSQFAKSLRSGLDLWFKYTWEWTHFSLTPEFNVGWQHEYFDKDHSIHYTALVASGPKFPIPVFGAGRNTLTSGVDLFFEFFKRYSIEAMYDFQWNNLCHDNSFYLGFDVRF